MINILKMKTYPHYEKLPVELKHNLNLLRTNIYTEGVVGCINEAFLLDENDIEFLTLGLLVLFVEKELPDYDLDFLKAAARLHKECFEDELFSYFAVDEEDLYVELLHVKDTGELKQALNR